MLTFDENSHQYAVDGNPIPSVTQVINEWNKVKISRSWWYVSSFTGAAIPGDIFDAAGDWGKAVHRMIEFWLNDDLDEESLNPALTDTLNQFQNWMDEYRPEVVSHEKRLFSKKYWYAGTYDLACHLKEKNAGRVAIIDFKTGAYDMAGPQLSGYAQLYKEAEKYRGRTDRYVLHLPKKGGPYKFVKMDNPHDFDFFLCRLRQWQYLNQK